MISKCPYCKGKGKIELNGPEWLQMQRRLCGLTLKSVARLTGLHKNRIHGMEKGRRPIIREIIDFYES